MRRSLPLLVAAALVVGGCGGGSSSALSNQEYAQKLEQDLEPDAKRRDPVVGRHFARELRGIDRRQVQLGCADRAGQGNRNGRDAGNYRFKDHVIHRTRLQALIAEKDESWTERPHFLTDS